MEVWNQELSHSLSHYTYLKTRKKVTFCNMPVEGDLSHSFRIETNCFSGQATGLTCENFVFSYFLVPIMSNVHPVSITLTGVIKTYSTNFQTANQFQQGWRSALKAAYGRAEVRCGCSGMGAKRLAIKHYDDTDQFSLARFSMTGGEHASDCQFYSANSSQTGLGTTTINVVDPQADGSVLIRLEIGMVERETSASQSAPIRQSADRPASVKRSSIKLLGLLHYLWDAAELNQWRPGFTGKRRPSLAYWLVHNAADDIWIGNVKLALQLLLPAFGADTREAERNRDRTASALSGKRRMLVIAPLAAWNEGREAQMEQQMKIAGFHGMPIVYMQEGLWASTMRRFANAMSAWRNGTGAVAIAQIELRQGKHGIYATAIDVAIMAVTAQFIPVESSYERVVAEMLVSQHRSFSKPLRFDASSEQVLPDFLLTDTPKEVPMEVFGRSDTEYLKRKAAKKVYYDDKFGAQGWWYWDAVGNATNVPPFPSLR